MSIEQSQGLNSALLFSKAHVLPLYHVGWRGSGHVRFAKRRQVFPTPPSVELIPYWP